MGDGQGSTERQKLKVPPSVFRGLEEVRQMGAVNMLDWKGVQYYAYHNDRYETVNWLEENSKAYVGGILSGIESEDGDTERIQREVAVSIAAGELESMDYGEDDS